MKKMLSPLLVLALVIVITDLSFAAYEFYTKGAVIKVSGNKVTIKDDKGEEITVEGSPENIRPGDKIFIIREKAELPIREKTGLSAADRDFLKEQCQVPQQDIDVVPQLSPEIQDRIFAWIAAKDCKKLVPLKASRNYFRQLKPNVPLPLPPAGWSGKYLTEAEFKRYVEILDKAPW